MCAVILDTVGRELMIRREFTLDHEVRAQACLTKIYPRNPCQGQMTCRLLSLI